MALRITTRGQNAAATGLAQSLDVGLPGTETTHATMRIRTGPQPATPNSSSTGTVLATLTMDRPAFGNPTAGQCVAGAITSAVAVASGTAGWFEILDQDGNKVMDGSCGQGSGDISFSNAVIVQGGMVAITDFQISIAGS